MIKEALLIEINKVRDPHVLHQLYDYLRLISNSAEVTPKGDRKELLHFAGTLTEADATAIQNAVTANFNQIEGEW